jgi:hypothetical protein
MIKSIVQFLYIWLLNQNNITALFENISIYSALLPLLVFLIFFNRNQKLQSRVIFFYVIYSFLNDQTVVRLYYLNYDNLIYLINSIFTIIEYIFFASFLYLLILNKNFKKFILICSILFITFSIFFYLNSERTGFDSLPAALESIFIIIYCIFSLYEQLDNPSNTYVYNYASFWFTIGFLVYLAGTFFLFLQAAEMPIEVKDYFWRINLVCNILKNIFFAIAFYLPDKSSLSTLRTNPYENNHLTY